MSELSDMASKNFEKYVSEFFNGQIYLLPQSRLSQSQWNALNDEIASRGIRLIPILHEGKQYMRFRYLTPRDNAVAPQNNEQSNETDVGLHLRRYTGFDWEHKVKSGLGYEHYRLNVSSLSPNTIAQIQEQLKQRAINVNQLSTNKGVFLVYNVDAVRSAPPQDFVAHDIIFDNVYNKTGVALTDDARRQMDALVRRPVPNVGLFTLQMVQHTAQMVEGYAAAGALSKPGIEKLCTDLRNAIMHEFVRIPDIANAILNWGNIDQDARIDAIKKMHYVIGSIRRRHDGNTVVNIGDDYYAGGGFNGARSNVFSYNSSDLSDFDSCMNMVVHENIHGFQKYGKSAVVKSFLDYVKSIADLGNRRDYINKIDEVESRYVATHVGDGFRQRFVEYYVAFQRRRDNFRN